MFIVFYLSASTYIIRPRPFPYNVGVLICHKQMKRALVVGFYTSVFPDNIRLIWQTGRFFSLE